MAAKWSIIVVEFEIVVVLFFVQPGLLVVFTFVFETQLVPIVVELILFFFPLGGDELIGLRIGEATRIRVDLHG
jgi:hypothetical protein